MSQSHIDAWDRYSEKEEEYRKATENMSRDERRIFHKKWKEKSSHIYDPQMGLGKSYRGSFLDLESLVKIIESQDSCYGICECYYTYILIERIELGQIDPVCWGDDGEIWYKMDDHDRYQRINKPNCFEKTCNFT
jgi:hypothetical protein